MLFITCIDSRMNLKSKLVKDGFEKKGVLTHSLRSQIVTSKITIPENFRFTFEVPIWNLNEFLIY